MINMCFKLKCVIFSIFVFSSIGLIGQIPLFYDNFNQTPVNPIVSSGQPAANYTIWTTVTPPTTEGGTALIEDYATGDGMIKLLARNSSTTQTGDRTEVSAPLSVYNAPFNPTLNQNTKDLEWIFTLKQNRNSAGGTNGFNGTQTGLAVVLVSDQSIWGSQQGSLAKGYAVTFLKPTGQMYCASLSKFNGGLSTYNVIIGNKAEDVFSEFKTWITVKVTYSPSSNEWKLYFRDEHSTATKGDITNPNGLKLIGSVVDDTYTNIAMSHFGFALNTPTPPTTGSANANAMFVDDFTVKAVDGAPVQFTLNVTKTGTGVVNAEPNLSTYGFGSQVQLTAVPDEGYIFEKWSGDVKSFINPTTVVINSDMNVVANFVPKPQELVDKKKMIHYDEVLLEGVKTEIAQNNSYFVDAYNALMSAANSEMTKQANPVTNKTLLPASGDIHDYYSIGPYWWPDPSKPDGLPWINKDGEVNPMTRGDDTDQVRFSEFLDAVEVLTLAYSFSLNTEYAFKAIDLLNIWLIDDATKMNPNANYAQAVPGRTDGNRFGIIEFVKVHAIITALQIMENNGILPETTKVGVSSWLQSWTEWLLSSDLGIAEGNADNNHASWYDFQVMGLLLYDGNIADATTLANDFKTKRIATQINTDGSQPKELSRTKSVNYSTMNLWAMTWMASMSQQVGVDLWNYQTTDGRSIKKAYNFLLPYVLNPSTWTWEQISNGGAENALNTLTKPLFSKAGTIFREDLIDRSENAGTNLSYVEKLVFPPREQIIVTHVRHQKTVLEDFTVFPNPSTGKFNIQVQEPVVYKVFSLSGALILTGNASGSFVLDLSNSNNSVYILQIESKDKVGVTRIVKI